MEKFSVLMSLYYKEKPQYLEECFNSLLNQTVCADEWVIVKDGPLTDDLESVLKAYDDKYPGLLKFVNLKQNMGLGLALKEGILKCHYNLIARMDTDDIAIKNRFELQLKEFSTNTELDICGGQMKEFEGDVSNIVSIRRVPIEHNDIAKYQKKRSAFNHITVMFKKDSVLKSGNYEHAPLMEDDMLWVNMLKTGCLTKNLNEFLCFARIGEEMISRRGGIDYFIKYRKARKKIYDTGYISYWDYLYTLLVQLVVCIIPANIRYYVFIRILRK